MTSSIHRSFTGGEIAPVLHTRADIEQYIKGIATCENFIIRPQGGAYSRTGMKFIDPLVDEGGKGRLYPFVFNSDQTYMLVFENLLVRVISKGVVLASVVTPYTSSQLPDLYFAQDADVMVIVHHEHAPRQLVRSDDTAWALSSIDFTANTPSPLWTTTSSTTITAITNDTACEVTVVDASAFTIGDSIAFAQIVAVVGTEATPSLADWMNGKAFTLTAMVGNNLTFGDFDSSGLSAYISDGVADVGELVGVGEGGGTYNKTYTYVVTAVDADGIESLPSATASATILSLSDTWGMQLDWVAVPGAEYYRVYKDLSTRSGVYGWIADVSNTAYVDFNIAPNPAIAPPANKDPFVGAGNYPSVVGYYQQRQVYANTINEPQKVLMTQTGNYQSMRTSEPARDDDAISFTVRANQVNEVRHLPSINALLVLTSGAEWKLTEGQDGVVTPSTAGIRPQSFNGCSNVRPVIINSSILYVQEKGQRVRDLGYNQDSEVYTGNDLSLTAEHMFSNHSIVEMAFASEPYGILWCLRDDGALLGLTYQREYGVFAWHRHITDGVIESIHVVDEDNIDTLYLIVNRTIDGVNRRYVERLEERVPTSMYMDCAVEYNGPLADTISGLDHLEGKTVAVVADDNEVIGFNGDPIVVTGGSITIPYAAENVKIGLAYLPVIETLDLDIASATQTIGDSNLSVNEVTLHMFMSRGGWIGERIDDGGGADAIGENVSVNQVGFQAAGKNMQEIKPRMEGFNYDPVSLLTGKFDVTLEPTWNRHGGIRIEQRSPFPLAVLSITPRIDVSRR